MTPRRQGGTDVTRWIRTMADRDDPESAVGADRSARRGGWLRWLIVITATLAMGLLAAVAIGFALPRIGLGRWGIAIAAIALGAAGGRSEEHTSELQSLMRISYAVFCLKKKKQQ